MQGQEEQGNTASIRDEVAQLARRYLDESGSFGLERIDAHILRAVDESLWDDVSKWHRVRLRFLRFQQERNLTLRHAANDSPAP